MYIPMKRINRQYNPNNVAIIIVVAIILGLFGFFLYNNSKQKYLYNVSSQQSSSTAASSSSSPNQTTSVSYTTLSPAQVPSKVAECSQTVTYSSNGNSGPVQCSNGDLNVQEWTALAALEPTVMKLGYSATSSQVQSALCNDVSENISNPIEETVYQISSLYYGWHFSSNPEADITNGTCQNVDD